MIHCGTVGDRIAFDFADLGLPMPEPEAVLQLSRLGFVRLRVDLLQLARECVGRSAYRRGADPREAPGIVDCSSLIKWLFGRAGVWLPRRTIQQHEIGQVITGDPEPGDVIYRTGRHNWFHQDPALGVGHVGLYAGNQRIIHAANGDRGVVEEEMETFLGREPRTFRGTRRFLTATMVTFQVPERFFVETPDDLRWILLGQRTGSS